MINQRSLSGEDDRVMVSYTFADLQDPTPLFLKEIEGAIMHPAVEHVYLSGEASSDLLLPYIALLHKHRVPFTIVDVKGPPAAMEIIRNRSL